MNIDEMIDTMHRNCDVPVYNVEAAARLTYHRLGDTQLERKPVCPRISPYQMRLTTPLWINCNLSALMRFMHWDQRTRMVYDWDWKGWRDTNETQTNQFWGMIRLVGDALNANETTADVYGPVEPTFVSFDENNPEHNLAETQMSLLDELAEDGYWSPID